MKRTAEALVLALLLGEVAGAAVAQARPEFELASVRPAPGAPLSLRESAAGAGWTLVRPGGRFEGDRVTVEQLLWFAFDGLRDYQFAGFPQWVRTDKFVVSAKAPADDVPVDQIRLMVRSLLEDRFGMRAHMESREMQVRALVWARPGAALGPGVFRVDSCTRKAFDELRQKFPKTLTSTSTSGGGYGGCSAGFKELAYQLTALLQEPFVDATGLEGLHFFQFSGDIPRASRSGLGRPLGEPSDLPPLSAALEKELNLKIEQRKGPTDVLVVDAIAQPTDN